MLSWGLSLSLVAVALVNFGCKSELAMPSGTNSIGNGNSSTLNPLTNPATADNILLGKKAYDSNGNVLTGTLDSESLDPNSTAVPAGYYEADTLDSIDMDLNSSNIRSGVTIFGITGSSSVVNTSSANASSSDLLLGKTAYVNGALVTGNVATQSLSNSSTAVPAGYYNSTTLTAIDADLVSLNIKSGVTIFGVAGNSNVVDTSGTSATSGDLLSGKTAYVNGALVTGTIAAQTLSNDSTAVPAGYYSATNLATVDADLVSSNIKSGKTIFGVVGDSNVINTQSATPATTNDLLSGKTAFVNGGTIAGGMANQGGLWDLGDAFPGSGYYSAINPVQTLSASKVCTGYKILGSNGSAICQSDSNGTNADAENVLIGKYYWNSLGQSVQGTMANKSNTWDLTTTFPGTGYYSGISPALSSSDVCSTKNFLGNTGTAVCQGASGGTNASTDNVLSGKYFWNASGQSVQGTMTDQGSSWDLTTGFPGAGYYGGINPAISASDVCSNKTFLGSSGTAVCNSTFGDLISTMAPRKDNATVDLSVPGSLNRSVATISQEVSGASQFTSNHNLVPDPRYDNDGRYATTTNIAQRHYLETILVGRPTNECGTSGGSIDFRISDCSTKNGSKAFYDGRNYGQNGEGDWKLVTLTVSGREVWRDERTKLIWSDRLSTTYNWCQASGFYTTGSTLGFMTSDCGLGQPGSIQTSPPTSACVEDGNVYTNPDESSAKGSLGSSSTPQVTWRIPTIHDWMLAEVNGIRKVLPQMDGTFSSGTTITRTSSTITDQVHAFNGLTGGVLSRSYANGLYVRCVGR